VPDAREKRRERAWIAAICVLAGLRVFLFGAAFPLMNNVDEAAHFDVVYKYAAGAVPRASARFDAGSSRLIALYAAPDYLRRPEEFGVARFPPEAWRAPDSDAMRAIVDRKVEARTRRFNIEVGQAPLYYAAAAAWYRFGLALGLTEGLALYWIRFLDVPVTMLLVALAHAFLRRFFPATPWFALAGPVLLVAFPQDVFYSINNDVPVALAFAAAFFMAMRILLAQPASARYHAAAGLLAAAAVLVKLTNLAILGVVLGVVVLGWSRDAGAAGPRRRRLALFAACALAPVAAWVVSNAVASSDPTGQAVKFATLGWTLKSPAALWPHPIFTFAGAGTFAWETVASFWRGEFFWHGARLAWTASDAFYVATSLAFLGISGALVMRRSAGAEPGERLVLAFCFAALAFALAPLVAISVAYDFGACLYPSREHPFMSSGRLLLAALVPFLALYLTGLERLLRATAPRVNPVLIVVAISVAILASEIWLSREAFLSANNGFQILRHAVYSAP
jgi:hypothetical protein